MVTINHIHVHAGVYANSSSVVKSVHSPLVVLTFVFCLGRRTEMGNHTNKFKEPLVLQTHTYTHKYMKMDHYFYV